MTATFCLLLSFAGLLNLYFPQEILYRGGKVISGGLIGYFLARFTTNLLSDFGACVFLGAEAIAMPTYEFQGWHTHFLRKIETVKHDCHDLAFYARKASENEPFTPNMIGDIERAEKDIQSALEQVRAIRGSLTVLEAAE